MKEKISMNSPVKRHWGWAALAAAAVLSVVGLLSLAAANPPDTARYTGRVADSEGRPLAGAVVEGYQYPEQPPNLNPEPELVTNLTTGVDGKFEFSAPADTWLFVRHRGLAPAWRWLTGYAANDTPIVLSPPTTLAGVVVDEAGKPVGEAEVFVSAAHAGAIADPTGFVGGNLPRRFFSSRTDARGHFQIENFPANSRAELGVSAPGKVLPTRWVRDSSENLLCWSGQRDLRLVVEPPAEISGKIRTETGYPLTNVWVELQSVHYTFAASWEPASAVTDGAFRFRGLGAGAYRLMAHFGSNQPPDWVAAPVPVTIQSRQHLSDVQMQAVKGAVLRVRTTDRRTGKPLPQVEVIVLTGSDRSWSTSDGDGLALFRLLPGRHRVSGFRRLPGMGMGIQSASADATVDLEAGRTNEVGLEFGPPSTVSVVVRDPSGKPAPGLSVWRYPGSINETKTDDNGRFQVLRDGRSFVVVVVDATRDLAVSREVEEDVTNLDLELAPALTITGGAEDSRGEPIPNAAALACLSAGRSELPLYLLSATTDAQGCFKLAHLPARREYNVYLSAKGFGSACINVPDEDDHQIKLPPAILKPANLELMGRVVDASQTPLANARVMHYGRSDTTGQPDVDVRTDAHGRFALEVCEGTVSLLVSFQDLSANVQAQAGETNVVVMLKSSSGPSEAGLRGKPLPDLAAAGLTTRDAPASQPVLALLIDAEQRPCRRVLRLLGDQAPALKQKGVAVVVLQSGVMTDEAFIAWKQEAASPFPVGRLKQEPEQARAAWGARALPWFILTDKSHRVIAEGFTLDDLDAKLGELK